MFAIIRKTITKYMMFSPGDIVVVAVSGGPDSITLLHALWMMREELGILLSVAHLNHGIRGKQADEEAAFVTKFTEKLGLPVTVEKVDLRALKAEMKLSMQEAARKIRYEFLHRAAEFAGANKIAVAHTADDQAETVLLNMARGAGIDGLAGIPPVREDIVRPLIEVSRADVMKYLDANNIPYRTDPTNLTATYKRNRVRIELIPLLEARFNPNVKNALTSLSELAREETDFVRKEAAREYKRLVKRNDGISLPAGELLKLHPALVRRVLRLAIEETKGDLRDIEFRQVEKALQFAREGREFTLTLPAGQVHVELRAGILRVFHLEPPLGEPLPFEYELEIPGRTAIVEAGFEIIAEFISAGEAFPDVSVGAMLDADKLQGRLVMRNWRPGDRITPLGMTGRKKLHDMFVDAKIPRAKRYIMPVIADEEKIVWVPGLVISELAKVEGNAGRVLRLNLHKTS